MIQVNFTNFELDPDTGEWVGAPVAQVLADGAQVTISGPHADWIDPDVSIVDPESGERVTRADDVERWARLLPLAYRNGDLDVEVAEIAEAQPVAASFRLTAAG